MGSPTEDRDLLRRMLAEGRISSAEFDQRIQSLARPSQPPPAPQPGWSGHTSMPSPNGSLPLPTRIGSYKVLGHVGRGGMGMVYRAIHRIPPKAKEQGGEVAIKVPHKQFAEDPRFQSLFEREAWNGIAMQRHPNIARVFDLVTESTPHGMVMGLVMEFVEGRPLSAVIAKETGPLPPARAVPLFLEALDALATAHGASVVHRDIKPENIMVTPDWHVKILDFGVARSAATRNKTFAGRVGTLDYMAPEQYDRTGADRVGPRSDLYALGMSLYEALAGRLPWDEETGEQIVISEKLMGKIPAPDRLDGVPPIPPAFVGVVMKAISLEPDDRFQSASEFAEALTAARRGVCPQVRAPTPPSRPPVARDSQGGSRRATELMTEPFPPPAPSRHTERLSLDETQDDLYLPAPEATGVSPTLMLVGALGLVVALVGFGFALVGGSTDAGVGGATELEAPSAARAPTDPGQRDAERAATATRESTAARLARDAETERQRQQEARRRADEQRTAAEEAAKRRAAQEAANAEQTARRQEEARRAAAASAEQTSSVSCSGGQDCQLRAKEARTRGRARDAIALYKKACGYKWGAGCYGAGMMYQQGQVSGRPDGSAAKEWFAKGCQYGHQSSCAKK